GLIIELWLWLGLIALGSGAGQWVADRILPTPPAERSGGAGEPGKMLAGAVLGAPIAYALISIFGGSGSDALMKQQIYFAVGMGVLLSVLAAQFVLRSQVAWWPLLVVGLVG